MVVSIDKTSFYRTAMVGLHVGTNLINFIAFKFSGEAFLDASSHLYMRLCLSVCPFVCPSIFYIFFIFFIFYFLFFFKDIVDESR